MKAAPTLGMALWFLAAALPWAPASVSALGQAAPTPTPRAATLQLAQAPTAQPSAAPSPADAEAPPLLLDDASLPADADAILRTPRFRQLAHELRCLVCQNQTLLDSNAPLAQDLRNEVIRLIASGRDDTQIKQYLVDRYGEFVLYRPSWSWRNALLWIGPALMLLGAGLVGWRLAGGRRTALAATGTTAGAATETPATQPRATPAAADEQTDGMDETDAMLRDAETGKVLDAQEALRRVDALLADDDARRR